MSRISVERSIAAPPAIVFDAVTNIEKLPETNADIASIEFLTDRKRGLGTRFRETRRMGKNELVTELEVTEFVEDRRARMVADTHGTIWDTVFEVEPTAEGSHLRIVMDARPHKLLPKIMNPLMKGFFRKGEAEGWRNELSTGELRIIEHLCGHEMQELGYPLTQRTPIAVPLRVKMRRLRESTNNTGAETQNYWYF